ncbi:hypothetical protein EHS25_000377 [Saitozyma podzolica]|uniref:Uncharacterized protein n=1 Tax=Saitozyma podzolica TaxID=1890683 RepID=A0A427YVY7_9TREE|nr:hypothetical protein EHS25_000377 [Saitozyma podzolica]
MLFAKFLLALPLFATASLSAPTGKTVAVIERASSSPVDVLSVVSNLQTGVNGLGSITPASNLTDVNLKLTALVSALNSAASSLTANANAGVSVGGGLGSTLSGLLGSLLGSSSQTQLKSQVATVLNEAITTINTLLGHISVDVAKQPEIAALLSSTDSSLVKVISNASKLVSGLLATLVAKLGGTNLTSSLGQVYNLLGPLSGLLHLA